VPVLLLGVIKMNTAYIIDAVRIPRAKITGDAEKKQGVYAQLKPVDLLKPLFNAICERNDFLSHHVDDVLLGCATQSGDQGANLAKIAALYAGWSDKVAGITLNRFCCSGLDAVNLAASKIIAGSDGLVVAGGVEQLTCVPMFSDRGAWYSDKDVMERTRFMHMGLAADLIAVQENYSRAQLDAVALQSHQRAAHAVSNAYFEHSIVKVNDAQGGSLLDSDNAIRQSIDAQKLASLPASFTDFIAMGQQVVDKVYPDTELRALHSAGNSPALVDGASLVLLANQASCQRLGLKPRARIRHFANASDEPVRMLTGHIRATEKLLRATNLTPADIDLWEVNESFAASALKYQQDFAIADNCFNVNGGAIAMGHPLGATGGNLLGMLLDELERRDQKRGVVAICGGAGVGVATLIERLTDAEMGA
jgi:acetyl-CoA C-acetyltransferase